MKKRLFSLLTSFMMTISLMCLMPTMSVGASSIVYRNIVYTVLEDNTLMVDECHYPLSIITIPSTVENKMVTRIGSYSFYDCDTLKTINLPDSIEAISTFAFEKCDNLETVNLPANLKTIGYCAFQDCYNLKNITIPDSVTSIGFSAFNDCKSLTSINFPKGITTIESGTFSDCIGLTNVNIPQNVKIIEKNAFANCTGLTNIQLHSDITSISTDAFKNCPLKNITVDENNAYYLSEDGVLFNKDKTSLILYPIDNDRESYVIPDTVETIEQNAFLNSVKLKSVTIPESVTTIKSGAFSGCTGLDEITIPDSVVTIEGSAFSDCTGITEIKIPSSVTSLGYAFAGCPIENIVVDEDNANYSSVDGVLFNKDKTKLILYPVANSRESYTIPESVTTIGSNAFKYSKNLVNIIIPDTVTNIGDYAISYCNKLINLTVPGSIKEMEDFVFSNCSNLSSVNIEEGVKELNYAAFYCCENLSSIILPRSLELIDYIVSAHCSNLTDVYYTGSESDWKAVSIYYNNYELKDATVHYNYVRPETQLSANIYYQLKSDNSTIRFVTEVDIKDVQAAESGEYTVSLNGEQVDTQQVIGAYKAIYANGELVEAPEGKCYVISKTYAGFSIDDSMTFEMNLSNYDKGVEREVTIS